HHRRSAPAQRVLARRRPEPGHPPPAGAPATPAPTPAFPGRLTTGPGTLDRRWPARGPARLARPGRQLMVTRLVRGQLVAFVVVALLGVSYACVQYLAAPRMLGLGVYQVSL